MLDRVSCPLYSKSSGTPQDLLSFLCASQLTCLREAYGSVSDGWPYQLLRMEKRIGHVSRRVARIMPILRSTTSANPSSWPVNMHHHPKKDKLENMIEISLLLTRQGLREWVLSPPAARPQLPDVQDFVIHVQVQRFESRCRVSRAFNWPLADRKS